MTDVLARGRYSVVRRLAQGGMGEVLLADFPGDNAIGLSKGLLVVKRVLPEHPNRAHQAAMLREEGRVALRLLHDNLVETFFVDEHEGDPLLVMEFMSGRAMSQVLGQAKKRKEHVPVEIALAVLHASACGLHFAHTLTDGSRSAKPLGLIHRDVSPANLFVTFDGRAKLLDFGVAKADDSEIRTSTGILKGKFGYMSPEHVLGDKLSPATDLWSLGVCFWETLCAERLFSMASPSATLHAISDKPIPSPLLHRPDLAPHIIELSMALLERRLEQRIGSGAALVEAIDALPEADSLRKVDLGGWLSGRFPEEAETGKSEARRCARLRRRTPVPIGLVEGTATQAPSDDAEQPTLVIGAAQAMIARDLLADEDAATVRLLKAPALAKEEKDDAPTKRLGAQPNLLAAPLAVEPLAVPPRTNTVPLPVAPQPPSPSPVKAVTPTATTPLVNRSSSWVAVAFLTFGALALAMGVAFSFLAPRTTARTVAAYEDASGQFDIVVAPQDAPSQARLVDVEQPKLKTAGALRDVPAAELRAQLSTSGVAVRAALPLSARGTLAILLPVLIAGLGLLALALAVPALIVAAPRMRLIAQMVLVLTCVAGIAAVIERGGLSWPGLHAWRSAPRLEMR